MERNKKTLNVRWLEKAAEEFDSTVEYLAERNPDAAKKLAKAVLDAVDLLAKQPHLSREGRVLGTREFVVKGYPYLIPFRVINGELQILRVFHTRQNLPSQW